ncbi:hypothetical protein FD723_34590 (plasmid) [Nostoc sp. C052]|uniref:hypothetical protein n=1 Tax=Nostoc sp. C052 TaxID=2576902 RepID=UPI0015C4077C|nr:hypothetical protein [Nostoc sp. C052]QLE45446.1 hypothetical protein FD723_34590 [Nostoc sp. C052]
MRTVLKSANRTKKCIQIQVAAIASILLFSNLGASGQTRPITTQNLQSGRCEPIAKIIKGDRHWASLSKVCKSAQINPEPGSTVEVFCYLRGSILQVSAGTIGAQCLPLSARERSGCSLQNEHNCINIKGPNDDPDAPKLITPYGVTSINPRPMLSWATTPGASSYIVQVEGIGVSWSLSVQNTQLPYPKDQPGLQAGNVYDVNIIAKRGEKFIASQSLLVLVSEDRAQQVATTIKRLQSLKQSPDEVVIDTDAVYNVQGLVDESIAVLSARAKAGSQDPAIYRLLGERYLQGDALSAATSAYGTAIALAQKVNNPDELAKAQAGAKIAAIAQSQLPTRIKAAQ